MGKQHLLIIDDEPLVLSVLGRLLSQKYNVQLCSSIEQGRDYLTAHEDIDLVIVDYMVGDSIGLAFLNEVRRNHPHVRRMLMSGKLTTEVVANTFNNELAHRVIQKPWHTAELLEMIHEVLNRQAPSIRTMPTPKMILQGELKDISVSDIICLLTSKRKSGILILRHDKLPEARIYLRGGRVVDAVESGNDAAHIIQGLFQRQAGTFQFLDTCKFDESADEIPVDEQIIMI